MYEYKFIPCSIGSDFAYTSGNKDIDEIVNAHLAIGRSVPVVSNPDDFPFDTAPKTKED